MLIVKNTRIPAFLSIFFDNININRLSNFFCYYFTNYYFISPPTFLGVFFTDPNILMIYIYLILYIIYISYDICIKLYVCMSVYMLLNYDDISIYYFNSNE